MAVPSVVFLLLTNFILIIHGSYHWIVTENGKIQSQVQDSGYPLLRPYDVVALLEQEQRITAISSLYEELVTFKKSIDDSYAKYEEEQGFEETLHKTDKDCIMGGKPLVEHDLTTEFMDYTQELRPLIKQNAPVSEPDCTLYSELDFSMMTFPHLETLNKRDNLTLSPPAVKESILFDFETMLKKNRSDWTAYNIASLYWRITGNGTNALECARRALYFSPRDKRHIALLNLGTLLQELQSLGESAIVLHSAVDHDPLQHISHLALGNVYVLLGDYRRSIACYENVLSLNPEHEKALQLKHAIYCQEKLESKMLSLHASLEKILHDIQKYHEMTEKWQKLQNQVTWNRDNKVKEHNSFSQPTYFNLRYLLANVEKQATLLMKDMTRNLVQKKDLHGKKKNKKNKACRKEDCALRDFTDTYNYKGDEDTDLEILDSSESLLKSKMNSLMAFIKALSEETDVDVVDFKTKIHQQINFLKNVYEESNFSPDHVVFLTKFDGCVESHDDFKSLNECFMKVLDNYSISVSNRIEKLKESMQLVGQYDSKKNYVSDESSLENYIEVTQDTVMESESCQRFRDTNEL